MASKRDNQILTQTGAGTPMGALMRHYWIPAAKSDELVADGDPLRLMLLGEKLIAFRDTSGRVGIMDHRCPHRCASLFFGRNEEDGIRCVYHGWKFDVDGNCLDMANVPPTQDFKHKVKARAYRAAERNGLIWVYMGNQENVPPLPDLEANLVPAEDMEILFIQGECNWLQSAESELDTSHLGFLHMGITDDAGFAEGEMNRFITANRAPEFEFTETDFGTMYGAYRPADAGNTYWRVGQFLWPCWTMPPICPIENNILARAYVPMDDTHTMMVYMAHKRAQRPGRTGARPIVGAGPWRFQPNTTDWHGRFRLADNRANDYSIDRDVQRSQSYTGITGINLQDRAMVESMGEIEDRSLEHLAPSDIMITQTRRHLLAAIKAFQKDGTLPKSALDASVYTDVRGGQYVYNSDADWLQAHADKVATAPLKAPVQEAAE